VPENSVRDREGSPCVPAGELVEGLAVAVLYPDHQLAFVAARLVR
jgi:hypothetical protein